MSLNIKILNGERSGKSFTLQEDELYKPLKLIESEAISFEYIPKRSDVVSVSLVFDEIELEFLPYPENDKLLFKLEPKRKGKYFIPLFHNYFGMAFPLLKLGFEDDSPEFITLQPIDVLASKMSAKSAQDMFMYVVEKADHKLLQEICPTTKEMSFQEGGEEPKFILEKLESTLKTIEPFIFQILAKPISKLSYSSELLNGSFVKDVDDYAYAWLLENLSVLEEVEDRESSHFEHESLPYRAKELFSNKVSENTDVYENRVIFSFLIKLKRFVIELENHSKSVAIKDSNLKFDSSSYVSFFEMINDVGSGILMLSSIRIHELKIKLNSLFDIFKYKITVSKEENGLPLITEKVKNNRSYLGMFKIINEWYKFNKIDWSTSELYLSIKNTPTLFEIYCALSVKESLYKRMDRKINSLESNVLFEGEYDGSSITLEYEPDYWGVTHRNSLGKEFLSTQIKYFTNHVRSVNNHKFNKRTPDFAISIKKNGLTKLILLDAKYSKVKTSFEERLPECIVKYNHSIYLSDGGESPITSLILISPNKEFKFSSMHFPPFDLDGTKTVFPVLGVQGIEVTSNSEQQFEAMVFKLLDKTISLLT